MANCEWCGYIKTVDRTQLDKLTQNSSADDWFDALKNFKYLDAFNDYHYICRTDDELATTKTTFLHLMAQLKAPDDVITTYREKDRFFSLKDEFGKMAIEYVETDDEEYRDLFKPQYKFKNLNFEKLKKIEKQFHEVINSRAKELILKHKLILPDLSCYVEKGASSEIYFGVPGMYGGFSTTLKLTDGRDDVEALISRSWCRVVGGSGEEHRCTENGWELTESGFV